MFPTDEDDESVALQLETASLEREFQWVLDHEVHNVLKELSIVLGVSERAKETAVS